MELAETLSRHLPADAKEAADLRTILGFVSRHTRPFDRGISEGHLTGSAFVVSADGRQVLLLHHRKLGCWLQPGGHGDPGEDSGEQVARREAVEETGLGDLALHPSAPRPLDVDVHLIPARPGEGAHHHLDLRYLFVAPNHGPVRRAAAESSDLRWFAWEELPALGLDPGLLRGLGKARAHRPPPLHP